VRISGNEACTNGKVIYLPALPMDCEPELLAMARGFVDHEAAHIRHTDFAALKAAKLDPVTFNLFNCLEDWRIEKKLSGIFPGCRHNLNWLIRRFFVEEAEPRAGDDPPALAVWDYVLLTLYPWNKLGGSVDKGHWAEAMVASPFVQIFDLIGIPSAAHVLNFVVLTAALSVYNSCVYCNSRMLYGLALQGNAPKALATVSARGVPVYALMISSGATLLCVVLNYFMPAQALGMLMALVVAALVINWAMISLTHMKFRAAKVKAGEKIIFKAFWYPLSNYLCLLFMAVVLVVLTKIGMRGSVAAVPVWLLLVWAGYKAKKKYKL
ncbi:Cobalamin biosynthesis protein CobT, partial [Desulfovibrio desulfuricans]